GGDEMHLRCAGVAEHHVDARGHKTPDQGFAADHPAPASTSAGAGPSIAPGLRMPSGSKAALILAMSASFAGSSRARKWPGLSVPMPCSPDTAPPRAAPA